MKKLIILNFLALFALTASLKAGSLRTEIFNKVEQVKKQNKKPIIVFDLDSTLMNNGPRSYFIMKEYVSKFKPELYSKVSRLNAFQMPYWVKDHWKAAKIDANSFMKDYLEFWKLRFFSDSYQAYDVAYEDTSELVSELHKKGVFVVYLTGRDIPRMLVGTTASLQQFGFPLGDINTLLLMKPDKKTDDTVYKATVINWLKSSGEVVATFDNEPKNVNLFSKSFPKAKNVFLDTNCAHPEVKLRKEVISIKSFTDKDF